MLAQYTAAALVSELKVLAVPASVDSIPTSAGQEDHVSMGMLAARKARRAVAAQIASSVAAAAPGRKGRKAKTMPAPEPVAIAPSHGGMGLGFFIARTLLERTGGKVAVGSGDGATDRTQPRGARVAVRWPRPALEVATQDLSA